MGVRILSVDCTRTKRQLGKYVPCCVLSKRVDWYNILLVAIVVGQGTLCEELDVDYY